MLSRARASALRYRAQQLNDSALYWADKALSLSGGALEDLVVYVQSLFACKQYRRAIHSLQSNVLLHQSTTLRYLAARCFAACNEWEEVLSVLSTLETDSSPLGQKRFLQDDAVKTHEVSSLGDLESAIFVLRATAHERLGDLHSAVECYKQALTVDVYCEEALDKLCQYHTLTSKDEKTLLMAMPFKKQCSVEEEEALKLLYQQKLKHSRKNMHRFESQVPKSIQLLRSNADVLCDIADHHLNSMNIDACYDLTSRVLETDPYHQSTLLLHIACCVWKTNIEELFLLGHRLVNSFPNTPLAWYAVSCYYIAVQKHQVARKYLTKAIDLDPNFAPAHMAFGISLATEGERDQAIAAFSIAARIMQGSHLPLMLLGREYYLTGAVSTSTKFMKSALTVAPNHPILLQEVGVMLYSNGEYTKAEKYFRLTIAQLQVIDPNVTLPAWEPVYNNLAHVLRKLQKFEEAIVMHECALQLCPNLPSSLTSIAFTYLLMGKCDRVVEYANQSLKLKREDQFTIELLHIAVEDVVSVPDESIGGSHSLETIEAGSELEEIGNTMILKSLYS